MSDLATISVEIDLRRDSLGYTATVLRPDKNPMVMRGEFPAPGPEVDDNDVILAAWGTAEFHITTALVARILDEKAQCRRN